MVSQRVVDQYLYPVVSRLHERGDINLPGGRYEDIGETSVNVNFRGGRHAAQMEYDPPLRPLGIEGYRPAIPRSAGVAR